MSDERLRELERAVAADIDDDAARMAWARESLRVHGGVRVEDEDRRAWALKAYSVRCLLVDLGRASETGLWVGDLVEKTRLPGLVIERRKPSDPPRRCRIICQGEEGARGDDFNEPGALPEPGAIKTGRLWLLETHQPPSPFTYGTSPFRMNTVSKGVGVLVKPMDPRLYRSLTPYLQDEDGKPLHGQKSAQRRKQGPRVAECLLRTWCVGADEAETRAYLKAHAPRNPSFEWRAFWLEARDQTNGWGRGIPLPMHRSRPRTEDEQERDETVAALEAAADPQARLFQ